VPRDEYRALDHPARRRIVELLGMKDSMAFSELRAETGLPVGTLYYHLDVLRGLVTQDEGRRYLLSKDGVKLYSSLADREGLPQRPSPPSARVLPGWAFSNLSSSLPWAAASWVTVAVLGAALSYVGGQALILMQFGVSVFPDWVDVALFPSSMAAYSAYCLLSSYLISGRGTGAGGLLAGGVAYSPYLAFPLVSYLVGSSPLGPDRLLFLILAIVLQGLSIVLGATYMSSVFGMRLERSLLLQLVFYVVATIAYSSLQYMGLIAQAARLVASST
jgi:hypothetical protein